VVLLSGYRKKTILCEWCALVAVTLAKAKAPNAL
jgi:hypothetical protein